MKKNILICCDGYFVYAYDLNKEKVITNFYDYDPNYQQSYLESKVRVINELKNRYKNEIVNNIIFLKTDYLKNY